MTSPTYQPLPRRPLEFSLAADLHRTGRAAEALEILRRLEHDNPKWLDDAPFRMLYGRALSDVKSFALAAQHLRRAADLAAGEQPFAARALAAAGSALRAMGAHALAVDAFRTACQMVPLPEPQWLVSLGHGLALLGDFPQAIEYFNRALAAAAGSDDDAVQALRGKARALRELNRLDESIVTFEQAVAIRPEFVEALIGMAEAYHRQGRRDVADRLLDQALKTEARTPAAMLTQAQAASQSQAHRTRARQLYDRAVASYPADASVRAARAVFLRAQGLHTLALDDLNAALTAEPENTRVLALRGETYLQAAQPHLALQDFERLVALLPDQAWAIACRGEALRCIGDHARAIADFQHARQLDPRFAFPIARIGEIHRDCGRFPQAIEYFREAKNLDPADAWTLAHLGAAYRRNREYQESIQCLDSALKLRPRNTWTLGQRVMLNLEQGRPGEALADLDVALEVRPESDWLYYLRGLICRVLGDASTARSWFRKAIELVRPKASADVLERPRNLANLALYLFADGETGEALEAYRHLLATPPDATAISETLYDLQDWLHIHNLGFERSLRLTPEEIQQVDQILQMLRSTQKTVN